MSVFTAAVVQMRSAKEPRRNAADMEALVREAAAKGATYVQTPEMTGALVRGREALLERIRPADENPLVRRAAEMYFSSDWRSAVALLSVRSIS